MNNKRTKTPCKCRHVWFIDDLRKFQQQNEYLLAKPFYSVLVCDKGGASYEWKLRLNFKEPSSGLDQISIQLVRSRVDVGPVPKMAFRIAVLDGKGVKILNTGKQINTFSRLSSSQCYEILPGETADSFLSKTDSLTVICKMFHAYEKFSEGAEMDSPGEMNDYEAFFAMEKSDQQPPDYFITLFEDQMFTDVTLRVGDVEFKAHKLVLAAKSPVFSAMFEHDMREKAENLVEIQDMEPKVAEQMLRYIYTGKVPYTILKEMETDLLVAADRYGLEKLKTLAERSIKNIRNMSNCLETGNVTRWTGREKEDSSEGEEDSSEGEKDSSEGEKDSSEGEKDSSEEEKDSSEGEKDSSEGEKDSSEGEKDSSDGEKDSSEGEKDSSEREESKGEVNKKKKIKLGPKSE